MFYLQPSGVTQTFHYSNGVLHRDIKADNFLLISLSTKTPVTCKIADFGTSRYMSLHQLLVFRDQMSLFLTSMPLIQLYYKSKRTFQPHCCPWHTCIPSLNPPQEKQTSDILFSCIQIYMAPEILDHKTYSAKVDVYSFGVCFTIPIVSCLN